MKRPTWATVVGIIGIVMGCFGILGGGQLMIMPKMMEMQKGMWTAMQESMEKQVAADPRQAPPKEMFKVFEKMWDVPEWFGTWCVAAGLIALLISGFYLFASIRLLQVKPTAVRLFYCAAGLSIGFALLKVVVALAATSFMGMTMMFGGMLGLIINVVLLIVVATGNKEPFRVAETQPTDTLGKGAAL
jgi:hypothetical protein